MSEAQQFRNAERRTHQITHEELRRQLIAADADRYGLQHQLSGPWSLRRRRLTTGVAAAVVAAIVGAGLWEKCRPAAAASHRSDSDVQASTISAPVVQTPIESEPQPAVIAPAAQQITAPQTRAQQPTGKPRRQSIARSQTHRQHHSFLMRTLLRVRPHLWPAARRGAEHRPLNPGEFGRATS